jgi:hypothetical protein
MITIDRANKEFRPFFCLGVTEIRLALPAS